MSSPETVLSDGSTPIRIAAMTAAHLADVLAIEQASFSTPWSEAAFRAELGGEVSHPLVALSPEATPRVAGFLVAWVVLDELRIQNVAVAPAWRRRGVGAALVRHALALGRRLGCRLADLEVRPSNAHALALYRKLGFALHHRRPRYYADTGEDALVLTLPLTGSSG